MKSLMSLCQQVLLELGGWCHVSTSRDWKTVSDRVMHEGISFITISLPAWGKDFDNALALERVGSNHFAGLRRRGGLPMFLRGFLRQVFDDRTGELLAEPSGDAVYALRQFLGLCAKIELPCSPRRIERAMERFCECEHEVSEVDIDPHLIEEMRSMLVRVFRDSLFTMDRRCRDFELVPSHGPGATADRLRGNQKWCQTEWPVRSVGSFPPELFLAPSYRWAEEALAQTDFIEPGLERPVKVTPVPKTLKTPRLIAVEPTCMQYMQQAILSLFVEITEADHRLRDFLGLTTQEPNQKLALLGSIDGAYATIDLSEASDRVSNHLVESLFKSAPHFLGALEDSRSTRADVPGHGVIPLSKFASMGSATCFPIEATVFLVAALVGIERGRGHRLTPAEIDDLRGKVRVFGDDIIVPNDYADSVISVLTLLGSVPNRAKTFTVGNFRESCGKEYFAGLDVTTVRVRRLLPHSRADAKGVAAVVALRNQLYGRGMWHTVKWLDERIRRVIPFPIVEPTSPAMGRMSCLPAKGTRSCTRLHRPLVKAATLEARIPSSKLDGLGALLKCLTKPGISAVSRDHLTRSGRPLSVNIKIGWVPVA